MKLVLPQNDTDLSGLIHKYPHISREISASSFYDNVVIPENVFDPFSPHDWETKSEKSSWISIFFPKTNILLSHYSLKTPSYATYAFFPRCWDVYGRYSNSNTEVLLSSITESGMNDNNITRVFPIFNNHLFNWFKFVKTCDSYHASQTRSYFAIGKIDFYGTLQEVFVHKTFKRNYFTLFCIIILIK